LENQMIGCLTKPINIEKLDEILCQWIPAEKQLH
jgi:hypothetical protein